MPFWASPGLRYRLRGGSLSAWACLLYLCCSSLFTTPALAQDCPGWSGNYYNTPDLSGLPVHSTCDPTIDFQWGTAAPADELPADYFSARWTSTQTLEQAGLYRFTLQVRDGVRLYVNGAPLLNAMDEVGIPRTLSAYYTATRANEVVFITLEMNHYQGEAGISLSWASAEAESSPPSSVNSGSLWLVAYYDNAQPEGSPIFYESYLPNGISRDYRRGIPTPLVEVGAWSSRWQRSEAFPEGIYTFIARANSSVRILIDDTEVLAAPDYVEGQTYTATLSIAAGTHRITVEHSAQGAEADLFVTWNPSTGTSLLPDGCNGETAGINGSEAPCPQLVLSQPDLSTPATHTATVSAGPLHLRAQPSQTAVSLHLLSSGEQHPAIGRSADGLWVQLAVGNTPGWSMAQFLTLDQALNALPITGNTDQALLMTPSVDSLFFTGTQAIALASAELYALPSEESTLLLLLPEGTVSNVSGRSLNGEWLQIEAYGQQGWTPRHWHRLLLGSLEALPVSG